jgi:hypothetical protein
VLSLSNETWNSSPEGCDHAGAADARATTRAHVRQLLGDGGMSGISLGASGLTS